MIVYVIRHGQTDWNRDRRLQGQKNIDINETGRGQARQNGLDLGGILGEDIDLFDFVASPLARTRETMEIIRGAMDLDPKDYRTDERLVEVSFGDWEGKTLKELRAVAPERLAERDRGKWDFLPPGETAESYEILSWRVASWLSSVRQDTVCVTHGGVIRSLFRLIAKISKDEASEVEIFQDRILRVDTGRNVIGWIT